MLKKISATELRVGMFIHELCGGWMDHPFWRSSFAVNDARDMDRVRECGVTELWIDTERGIDVLPTQPNSIISQEAAGAAVDRMLAQDLNAHAPVRQIRFDEEIRRAAGICDRSKRAVLSMFQEARMGNAVNAEAAGDLVDEISSSVMRNPGALISLARLKSADDYTYMHSVAVCALMVALGRQLGQDEATVRELGLAGLLHDLGKAMMPPDVLNKPGKLTDDEFAIMRSHPGEGHRLLLEGKAVGQIPLDVCRHHHEKMDGSGYPDHLSGEQISLYARMGAVCDVYDAITSNRPYKAGWDPAESIRKMAEWSNGHFDQEVFHAFVRSIGIYPSGSMVMLESGRLGIIVEQSSSLMQPVVRVFFSTKAQTYIKPELLDLSRPGVHDRIASREDPAKWGLEHTNRFLYGDVR
ncbi:MAG TPA: HD-GYP domain-containing protein [Rhodocyclaceae bacterium]|jgi:HD-GYP domain-containing protein (c-di-GMP phosphodiesterase class II)|nr:HD-GYP domain-containing protein [Rhodocyclaceae bacterium]